MAEIKGKVVLIGDTRVGKTAIVSRYLKGRPDTDGSETVGAVFHSRKIRYEDKDVNLEIWDTAGQEQYKSLGSIYYRGARAAIAVFDLADKNTLDGLTDWISNFRENIPNGDIFIAANKADLDTELTVAETTEWAEKIGAECFWTSAISGVGVDEIFTKVVEIIARENMIQVSDAQRVAIEQPIPEPNKKKGCC